MPRALITGITGQDGSYLAELLLERGYEVHGIVRRVALEDPEHRMRRIRGILGDLRLHVAALEEFASVSRVVATVRPDECYHLAGKTFVSQAFEDELSTLRTNISSTHCVLTAVKECAPECRVLFAASSEVFGRAEESPQHERTPFHPRSAYGISKVAGFDLTRSYRESYGLFAVSAIAYNHESPRRGFEFVTRKITSTVAKIKHGRADALVLGDVEARRDWGHAREYVDAMSRMLRHDAADDFVLATGRTASVRDFCRLAFECAGLDYERYVRANTLYARPRESVPLVGDARKACRELGWEARVPLEAIVAEMVEHDMRRERDRADV